MEAIREETALVEGNRLGLIQKDESIFLSTARWDFALQVSKMLATSSMLPTQFQGANGVANCMILLNLADRMKVDAFMLAQNIYIVHNRPGIEAKLAIALVEGHGKFGPIKYRTEGKGKTDKGVDRPDSCVAYATHLETGEEIEGPVVTWEMAKAEGWTKDKGQGERAQTSKWQTLPDLMFRYRAAMFFARVHDPAALLGLRTRDELEDMIVDVTPEQSSLPRPQIEGQPEEKKDIYAPKQETEEKKTEEKKPEISLPDQEISLEDLFDQIKKFRPSTSDQNMEAWKKFITDNADAIRQLPQSDYAYTMKKWQKANQGEPFPARPLTEEEKKEQQQPFKCSNCNKDLGNPDEPTEAYIERRTEDGNTTAILCVPCNEYLHGEKKERKPDNSPSIRRLGWLDECKGVRAEMQKKLGPDKSEAAWNRILMSKGYSSINDVKEEDESRILEGFQAELEA